MKFDPQDNLKTTCWRLFFIWLVGFVLVLLTTRVYILGFFYAVIVGPILGLIYHTAKAEMNRELCHKKGSKRGWLDCNGKDKDPKQDKS